VKRNQEYEIVKKKNGNKKNHRKGTYAEGRPQRQRFPPKQEGDAGLRERVKEHQKKNVPDLVSPEKGTAEGRRAALKKRGERG